MNNSCVLSCLLVLATVPLHGQERSDLANMAEVMDRYTRTVTTENPKYSIAVHRYVKDKALKHYTDNLYREYQRNQSLGEQSQATGDETSQLTRVELDLGVGYKTPRADAIKARLCGSFSLQKTLSAEAAHELAVTYKQWADTFIQEDEEFWRNYYFTSLDGEAQKSVDKMLADLPGTTEVIEFDYAAIAAESPQAMASIVSRRCR